MDKSEILVEIDKQIAELTETRSIFGVNEGRLKGFTDLDKIDDKIVSTRRKYYFYLFLSVLLGGLLYLAGIAQVFEFKLIDLSKSGLLIILAAGDIAMTIRNKIDLIKLKMIKNLLGLKQQVERE